MNTDNDILIDNYLRGLLTEKEVVDFKLKLESDAEFRKDFELEQALWRSQNDADWSFVSSNNDEVKTYKKLLAENDMQSLKKSLKQISSEYEKDASRSNKSLLYYLTAALIAMFLCVTFFMNRDVSHQELVDRYLKSNDLPSFVTRGDSEIEELVRAQEYFENGNYKDALEILEIANEVDTEDATIYLYTGIAQMKLKNYNQAERTFDRLIKSNLLDAQKGYWYKALLYLDQDRIDDSKKVLNMIISQSLFNNIEAKELLDALNDE